jgi:hypothetical protein
MRTIFHAIGAVLVSVGLLWLLQEYGVVPGSFMIYEVPWAHRGLLAMVLGVIILIASNQKRH